MKKLNVLIVDDVASMRKFVKYGLEKSFPDISVAEAANGKEAQAKLEKEEYDLVLCDWEMPYVNGEELLTWVRKHPILSKTPFIMVTSRSDKPSVLKAMHGGVDSYMIKPFTADGLAQKVMLLVDKADRKNRSALKCRELSICVSGTRQPEEVLLISAWEDSSAWSAGRIRYRLFLKKCGWT